MKRAGFEQVPVKYLGMTAFLYANMHMHHVAHD